MCSYFPVVAQLNDFILISDAPRWSQKRQRAQISLIPAFSILGNQFFNKYCHFFETNYSKNPFPLK